MKNQVIFLKLKYRNQQIVNTYKHLNIIQRMYKGKIIIYKIENSLIFYIEDRKVYILININKIATSQFKIKNQHLI